MNRSDYFDQADEYYDDSRSHKPKKRKQLKKFKDDYNDKGSKSKKKNFVRTDKSKFMD